MPEVKHWHRQTDVPLIADAQWSKPERKSHAGKLLIIGGSMHEFARTQQCYVQATELGIGECKVVLPSSLKLMLGNPPDIEYAPSLAAGSFSLDAEDELMSFINWSDIVLFPGEIGRNSETTQLMFHCVTASSKQCIITRDAFDVLLPESKQLISRPGTTLVLSFSQAQNLLKAIEWPEAVKSTMAVSELVRLLHELTTTFEASIVTYFETNLIAASDGEVVTTRLGQEPETWRVDLATRISLWQTWLADKPFDALATASWDFSHNSKSIQRLELADKQ
jgi:NAD(P)H-hydrate repair Nnr-like enzyme with NAD(P)H-hydrate dehydratase domain